MMPADITTLDAASILAACVQIIPVNTRVDQAIAVHKVALRALESEPADPAAWDIAANPLRAIIFARTPVAADYRTQLDYLRTLPEAAWQEHPDQTAPEYRSAILAMITRLLKAAEEPICEPPS